LATQSAYQYAHRHAEEIVAAGCELMDQCAEKRAGRKIDASDPSMPDVLRRLGARCVVVQENCVAVYVPGLPHTGVFVPGFADKEFHILRSPDDQMARVFVVRGKCRQVRITEQLWMAEDS
jgi:hypothetical protein